MDNELDDNKIVSDSIEKNIKRFGIIVGSMSPEILKRNLKPECKDNKADKWINRDKTKRQFNSIVKSFNPHVLRSRVKKGYLSNLDHILALTKKLDSSQIDEIMKELIR